MRSSEAVTVFVADDHPLFLDAIARVVSAAPDFDLVGRCEDGPSALAAIRELTPAVAIIDHQLPSLSGIEILQALVEDRSPTRVIILSADESGTLVYDAVQLGAAGFLTKATTFNGISEAIRSVARGGSVIGPEVQAGLLDAMRDHSQPARPVLTPRESEVLRLISAGLSAPAIGKQLFISTSTVKTHIKSIFEKLDVNDRASAVAEGMRRGLLE